MKKLVVINLGSTSTKIAYFEDAKIVFSASLSHPAEEILVPCDLLAHQEKGGAGPPLPEAVQQAGGGIPAGTVVKGQGHEVALRRKLHRVRRGAGSLPARQDPQEQGQKGAERPTPSLHAADLPCFR